MRGQPNVELQRSAFGMEERREADEEGVEIDGLGGVDFDDRGEGEGLGIFSERFGGHFLEYVRGMVTGQAGALGEAAGGFRKRDAAVDFHEVRGGEQAGELAALVRAAGAEVGFENEGGAMGCERPEEIHGGRADAAGSVAIAGGDVEGGEEGLLDVVFGKESEAEASGERASEGGLAGGGRSGNEDDAVHNATGTNGAGE